MRRLFLPIVGLCVLLLAGCKGTRHQETITIPKNAPYSEIEFRAPKSDQNVNVTATCDTPIAVYLALTDDKHEAIIALRAGKKPRRTVAGSEPETEVKLEAKIPAGKGFVVLLKPAEKDREVEVKLDVQAK